MRRWYEQDDCGSGIVIGCQIFLVRNLDGYPFADRLTPEQSSALSDAVCRAVRMEEKSLGMSFTYFHLSGEDAGIRQMLTDRLAIPPMLQEDGYDTCLLLSEDESVSILIGGSEHICIQVSLPGQRIQEAFVMANQVDDALNRHLTYAYSGKYGYLTASPLYTGTGLSASCLIHLHYLEKRDMIKEYAKELARFGFSLRGHFDGKGPAPGCIYRVKNRKTLGLSESEILTALEHLTGSLARQEEKTWLQREEDEKRQDVDQMYRAYGLARYARELDFEETLNYLSYLRLGDRHDQWPGCRTGLFSTMINMQDAVLAYDAGGSADVDTEVLRGRYIRSMLPEIGPAID